jgi:hypothetical protein
MWGIVNRHVGLLSLRDVGGSHPQAGFFAFLIHAMDRPENSRGSWVIVVTFVTVCGRAESWVVVLECICGRSGLGGPSCPTFSFLMTNWLRQRHVLTCKRFSRLVETNFAARRF